MLYSKSNVMKYIPLYLWIAVVSILGPTILLAQQSLSIVDALPPYDLTATLLGNGHFSISTRYTGESKTLVYREDGTGGRPVNYTSHIHFKVDDVLFQLPYELNPVTRETPPEHPMTITELFRDSVAGTPRVNARMFGVLPDGDTMRFVFSMQPVKRPSGGFIRLSAEVHNTTSKPHSVGVLMLVDSKIGDNDRAPIITAFGYQSVETQYEGSVTPGMPEFWLALEGSPVNPQLTARGNLRASGLIEPDFFLFGNWVDNNSIPGLASILWKERNASGLEYTDSAVLLIWNEELMSAGQSRLRASTEIGIVDSLKVQFSEPGSPYDVAIAGAGSCLVFETVEEQPCGDPEYHPYIPDSLQTLYIVTNRGTQNLNNVRVVVPQTPAGLDVALQTNPVIPAVLGTDVSGVATVTFYAHPRLIETTFEVPVAVLSDADTVLRDTVCVIVPGLLGKIEVRDTQFRPLCPAMADTLDVLVSLDGVRCLPITDIRLTGTAPDLGMFSLVPPLPTVIPANGQVPVRVRYQPDNLGNHSVQLVVEARDFETLIPRDTTFAVVRDVADITGSGRQAEFFFADDTDTLDLGAVCVGDTVEGEWEIRNVGGCDVIIDRAVIDRGKPNQFSIGNESAFPLTIPRGERRTVKVLFTPNTEGTDEALLIVVSSQQPQIDTLIVRGRGDVPRFTVPGTPLVFDTLCPGSTGLLPLVLDNPTACPVTIDSLTSSLGGFTVVPAGKVVIPPSGSFTAQVRAAFTEPGDYNAIITAHSSTAGNRTIPATVAVRRRDLFTPVLSDYGDVRLGTSATQLALVQVPGPIDTHAEVVIRGVRIIGVNQSEFSHDIPADSFPLHLVPGTRVFFNITFTPVELEQRHATLVFDIQPGTLCEAVEPVVELEGRGVLPVIDVPRRSINFGRVCVGSSIDTVIDVRNLGNAPLHVDGAAIVGSSDMEVLAQLPTDILVDSLRQVRVRFTPRKLGPIETELYFHSDGKWFSAPDTVVRLTGTGIICGTVWLDTLRLQTGETVDIPVHIRPAAGTALQVEDIARLMNEAGYRSIDITLAHNPKLFRFRQGNVVSGMMQGQSVTVTPQSVTATATTAPLTPGTLLAVLRGEVLLGNTFETNLKLTVNSFADGYADIRTHDGLLISEYCALDKRYVNTSGVQAFVLPRQTPLSAGGELDMYMPQAGHARLTLVNAMGERVAELFDGPAQKGMQQVSLGSAPLSSGMYTAVLEADGEYSTTQILIVK